MNYSPLHLAAIQGHLSIVEYLVNQKADINEKDNSFKFFLIFELLFIVRLLMVILPLLHSLFFKMLI